MSNEQIVKQIQAGTDVTENQERLWNQNRKFVFRIVKRYCGFDNDLDDYLQQGFLGLIIAAQKYKPDKGTRFITYAAFWIKQSIIRYSEQCAGSVRVPAYMKVNIRNYERFCVDYKSQTGGHPPEGEICQALGINKRSLKILEKVIYEVNAILSNASSVSGTVFEVSVGSSVMKFMVLDENEKTVQVGDNHANAISWFYTGNLFIPDSVVYNGESYSVIRIGDGAFYNRTLLTGELNIPSSVTSIGDSPVNIKAYDDSANGNNTGGGSGGSGGGTSVATSTNRIGNWIQDEHGWWYQYRDNSWPKNGWAQLEYNNKNSWYYFDEAGYMVTGWVTWKGRSYYLNPVSDGTKGRMVCGWSFIDGNWYYFNEASDGPQGALIRDAMIGEYYVNKDGVWTEVR